MIFDPFAAMLSPNVAPVYEVLRTSPLALTISLRRRLPAVCAVCLSARIQLLAVWMKSFAVELSSLRVGTDTGQSNLLALIRFLCAAFRFKNTPANDHKTLQRLAPQQIQLHFRSRTIKCPFVLLVTIGGVQESSHGIECLLDL